MERGVGPLAMVLTTAFPDELQLRITLISVSFLLTNYLLYPYQFE